MNYSIIFTESSFIKTFILFDLLVLFKTCYYRPLVTETTLQFEHLHDFVFII